MNSITKTEYWQSLVKSPIGVENMIKQVLVNRDKYILDKNLYSHLVEFRTYKYPMAKTVSKLLDKEKIKPCLFADPPIAGTKSVVLPNIFTIPFVGSDKSTNVLVDLSIKAGLQKDKVSGNNVILDMDAKIFYGFIQSAATMYILNEKKSTLKEGTFANSTAKLYTRMVSKVIDRSYPFSRDGLEFDTLNFLLTLFFYRVMFEYEAEEAHNAATKNAPGIKENIRVISRSIPVGSVETFSDVFKRCEEMVDTLKEGVLTYRAVLRSFIQMYGTSSIYSMEHFGSFMQMIQMSNLWMGVYNDRMVNNQTSKDLGKIEQLLGQFEV